MIGAAYRNPLPMVFMILSLMLAGMMSDLVCDAAPMRSVKATEFPPAEQNSNRNVDAKDSIDAHSPEDHQLSFSPILLELGIIIVLAASGRWVAERVGQSSVLGELLIGTLLGNIGVWLGIPFFTLVMNLGDIIPLFSEVWLSGESVPLAAEQIFGADAVNQHGRTARLITIVTGEEGPRYIAMGFAIWLFSELGVILLLFMVGLESQVDDMLAVGWRALLVAVVGVTIPFVLGYFASRWLLPESPVVAHLFLAATLCATSVGITARVLQDFKKTQTREAKIILGAAVIDDILGLILMTVVVGVASTGEVDVLKISKIGLLSTLFLVAIILCGGKFVGWMIPVFTTFGGRHLKLLFPLALAFLLAWVAGIIGLAPIVGAFAAGLILREDHFKFDSQHSMEGLIAPLEKIFAPIFFVLMGMQVDLRSFTDINTLWLALGLSVVAIVGKLACGIVSGRGADRWTIGLGMIPRGEVGLIFASIGRGFGVLSGSLFSAVVAMVIVTTLMTPVLLKKSLARIGDDTMPDLPELGRGA
ncbi:cation:proton antiporter [Stieleria sp. ICT_E10.1]|uniref:High-affinity Na(+)/H(+) antiporter NhaS3 n=1 Tax=Stieleria magnilauensis TaxID=2527963 RepID=A0ABX5XU40_9BACT|nr:cation:proton antiporter [Stieleria sedimenti]MCS7466356.1 cation:proton antiporter [Stieleria sedimenti]QDV85316.1 High-affinity Na(+)/H(+) antiporter NhaS3 [Planctomycetes bacterium TBK1r]